MNKELKEIMIKVTVNCMLNPKNEEFYVGTMDLDKLHNLIDNDSDKAEVVFTALGITQTEYLNKVNRKVEHIWVGCPECGCSTYIDGCRCPNCDYED